MDDLVEALSQDMADTLRDAPEYRLETAAQGWRGFTDLEMDELAQAFWDMYVSTWSHPLADRVVAAGYPNPYTKET